MANVKVPDVLTSLISGKAKEMAEKYLNEDVSSEDKTEINPRLINKQYMEIIMSTGEAYNADFFMTMEHMAQLATLLLEVTMDWIPVGAREEALKAIVERVKRSAMESSGSLGRLNILSAKEKKDD